VAVSGSGVSETLVMPVPTAAGVSQGDLTGIPPGTYTATYTPPAGFELVDPSQATQNVTVVEDSIQTIEVACQLITGTIRATATGLAGATAGGAVAARKSDNTGNTFNLNLPAPTAGASTGDITDVPPASYAVTYTPPSGFELVNPSSSPQTVAVVANEVANADFVCQVIQNPGQILFESDWSTAQGTGQAALRDTGKAKPWTNLVDNFNVLAVVSAAGEGLPAGMANCLQVGHLANTVRAAQVEAVGVWPAPAVGETLYFRLYLRNEIADNQGDFTSIINSHHPIQPLPGTCPGSWNWTWASKNDGTFPIGFNTETNPFPRSRWVLGKPRQNLLKNTTYRLEWRINRQSTGYSVSVRVYNAANTLLFDDNNIWDIALGATLAAAPLHAMDNACLDKLMVGTNGGSWQFTATQYDYIGGVCVRSDDWCGPY
jgi:hypothetical protein